MGTNPFDSPDPVQFPQPPSGPKRNPADEVYVVEYRRLRDEGVGISEALQRAWELAFPGLPRTNPRENR